MRYFSIYNRFGNLVFVICAKWQGQVFKHLAFHMLRRNDGLEIFIGKFFCQNVKLLNSSRLGMPIAVAGGARIHRKRESSIYIYI